MKYTLEQLGMLKMLEHLNTHLREWRRIKYSEIKDKIGIEKKYFNKLRDACIIDRRGSTASPEYKWIGIKPNIMMACETLKDYPDYNNNYENLNNTSNAEELTISLMKYFPDEIINKLTKKDRSKWIDAIYKLNTKDGYSLELIEKVVKWARQDKFWSEYLLSLVALRRKRDGVSKFERIKSAYNRSYDNGFKLTKEQDNDRIERITQTFNKFINYPFNKFWELYDLKVGPINEIKRLWYDLSEQDREKIMEHIPKYKKARPLKQYMKNPYNYLKYRIWEDEIVYYTGYDKYDDKQLIQKVHDIALELRRRGVQITIIL